MTAKQKANQARFKKVVAEAKKLRKKNPKLTQAQAVKQAWAILIHKDQKNPIKQAKKKITAYITKAKEDFYKGYYGDEYKKKRKKVGAMPTKVKAKKGKRTSEMHTDTKSHNVNIRVMSGVNSNMYTIRDNYEKEIKYYLDSINRIKDSTNSMTPTEKGRAVFVIKTYKKIISKLKKQLKDQNKLINDLLK